MVKSMTGYGRGEAADADYRFTLEMKSVNQRFLETNVRLPRQLAAVEETIKKGIQNRISRGKVDVFCSFEEISAKNCRLTVDKDLAIAYYNALNELAEALPLQEEAVSLRQIAAFPGVIVNEKAEEDLEAITVLVQQALDQALTAFIAMREREGAELKADLLSRKAVIEANVARIAELAPAVPQEYSRKLHARIGELMGGAPVDAGRLAQEVALFADHADISEELTRLNSHLLQFAELLEATEPIGRKLEFLLQEMNREVNTTGSKSNSLEISKLVIECKSELEKIREQIQNIE